MVQLEGQTSSWLLKLTLQPLTAMPTSTCEGRLLNLYNIFSSCFPYFRRQGASLHLQRDGCVAGGVPAGYRWRLRRGSGVTDDSEIVRLSDRVMAGRHSVTDQARREEIREEEGSLAALFFILGRYGEWGKKEKKITNGGCVAFRWWADTYTCWRVQKG